VGHSWNLNGWQGVDGCGSLQGATSAAVSDRLVSQITLGEQAGHDHLLITVH